MAVAELVVSDATADALDYMRTLLDDGIPRSEAARQTAQWCRQRGSIMDLVDTVVVAGFIALSCNKAHKARERFQRSARSSQERATLLSIEPAGAVSAAQAVLCAPARLDWLEVPYVYEGVEVALGDMTREQVEAVQGTYLGQAKGKLRHAAFLGEIKEQTPPGERVRDALDPEEIRHLGRKWFSTDTFAEILRGVHEPVLVPSRA